VRDALLTLPWVESDSIETSKELRQVRFKVKDKAQFDLEAAKKAISAKGYDNVKLLSGPTEK
jgi:hypothetical protein